MTEREQMQAFSMELGMLIDRYRDEFDLPYAAAIGVLQIHSHLLLQEVEEQVDID